MVSNHSLMMWFGCTTYNIYTILLGHFLFLLHINDLPSVLSSKVKILEYDCLIYRNIKNKQDQITLQKDGHATQSFSTTHLRNKDWRKS